jgi:hypothetical protein
MAIGVIFNFPGGTTEQYDEVCREEKFQAFGEKLMPLVQQAGLKPDEPIIFPAHNFVSQ